jgi:hypothetical protein
MDLGELCSMEASSYPRSSPGAPLCTLLGPVNKSHQDTVAIGSMAFITYTVHCLLPLDSELCMSE